MREASALAAVCRPTFAVVIPTWNEAEDIGETLSAITAQSTPPVEIVVVDGGSTDGTVDVVRAFSTPIAVKIVDEGARRGVAAARNVGIRTASAEVVVILNADVRPPRFFLESLSHLYSSPGTDFVSVESRVSNLDDSIGRFMQADHEVRQGPKRRDSVSWTEGFSCRRAAALAVGFPEEIPGAGGEDIEFVRRLIDRGYAWTKDFSIVVPHKVPNTLAGFWAQWRGRGNAIPYLELRVKRRPASRVVARRLGGLARSFVFSASIFPVLLLVARRTHHSPRGWRDFGRFLLFYHVQVVAHRYGEWQSLFRLAREHR